MVGADGAPGPIRERLAGFAAANWPSPWRKEPLSSASHVRSALSRFDQVTGVSDADRALAFENIRLAASYFDVHMTEKSWHDLMPPTGGG